MCSSYRSNQNPQTVKLSTPSSVHILRRFPRSPICVGFDADASKPPTYPFIHLHFKERGHKTTRQPETRAILPSHLQLFIRQLSPSPYRASRPAPLRLRRASFFASVRRCLGRVVTGCKRKNHRSSHFLRNSRFFCEIGWLAKLLPKGQGCSRNILSQVLGPCPGIPHPIVIPPHESRRTLRSAQTHTGKRLRGPFRQARTASKPTRIAA